MNIYYKDKNVKLIHGDCLEVMDKMIKDNLKVDAIITDPPYGTIKNAELDGWKNQTTSWDNIIDTDKMFLYSSKLLRENGMLILFSQEPYTSKLRTSYKYNINFCYPCIWLKDHFANALIAKKAPVNYFEDISMFVKKYDDDLIHPLREYSKKIMNKINLSLKQINQKLGHRRAEHFFYWNTSQFKLPTKETYKELINIFKINELDFFISFEELQEINKRFNKRFNLYGKNKKSNVFTYKKEYKRFHPTQKPVKLMEDLIKTYTNENELILDFACGSSSTLIAAQNTNRKCIGIEKEEKYCELSKKRLEENLNYIKSST